MIFHSGVQPCSLSLKQLVLGRITRLIISAMKSLVSNIPGLPNGFPHGVRDLDNPIAFDSLLASLEKFLGLFVLQPGPLCGPPSSHEVQPSNGILLFDQRSEFRGGNVRKQFAFTVVFNVSIEEASHSSHHDVSQLGNNPQGLTGVLNGFDEVRAPCFFFSSGASEEMKLSFFLSQATGTDLAISWMIVLNLSSNRKDAMQKFGVGSPQRTKMSSLSGLN